MLLAFSWMRSRIPGRHKGDITSLQSASWEVVAVTAERRWKHLTLCASLLCSCNFRVTVTNYTPTFA